MTDDVLIERVLARHERIVKRFIIALIIEAMIILAVVGISAYERLQYDYTSEQTSYSQDGNGVNNINSGTQGDIK